MSDLISRQAAIDALDTIHYTDREDWWAVLSTVENLPSAQPYTDEEIQVMQDLEQAQLDTAYELGWKEARDAKRTETHSCDYQRTETHGWIPVTEALPDAGAEVWVTIKGHDVIKCLPGETIEQAVDRISKIRWVTRGYWSEDEHAWNDPSYGCPLMVQPIAWMPIDTPEPWKGR